MVIRVDVVEAALGARYGVDPLELPARRRVVALAAGGRRFDDALAAELAGEPALTLLCGRYEGFDERVHEHLASDVVSIGPYVLSGGELAAMVVCDAVIRKLPGALGHEESAVEESFSEALGGAPEYPHYTRPAEWRGQGSRRCSSRETMAGSALAPRAEPPARRRRPSGRRGDGGRFATIRPCAQASGELAPLMPPVRPTWPTPLSMSGVIDSLERAQLRRVPAFQAGDRVRVHFQVVEGTRRRTQVFEGVVIKRQGSGRARPSPSASSPSAWAWSGRSRCTRPRSSGSRWPARGDVRRAKLYYLRDRVGRRARVRERRWTRPGGGVVRGAARCRRDDAPRPGEDELAEARVGGRRGRVRRGRTRRSRRPPPRRRSPRGMPRRLNPPPRTPRAEASAERRRRAGRRRRGVRRPSPRARPGRAIAVAGIKRRAPAARWSSWSRSSRWRSGSRSGSRPSSSSRSASRASRWCPPSRSASACSWIA